VKPDLGGWVRVPRSEYDEFLAKATGASGLRIYQMNVHDGHLMVLTGAETAGRDEPRWHLSISHRTNEHPPKPGRYPTWDEIKDARYRFMPPDIYVAQILPPADEFISVMDSCFHLWEIPEYPGHSAHASWPSSLVAARGLPGAEID
jgi:hypothetical protein